MVTAQKRAENVQDVPITSDGDHQRNSSKSRALDTRTLQLSVPALSYGTSSGFAMPFLRGIGSSVRVPGAGLVSPPPLTACTSQPAGHCRS